MDFKYDLIVMDFDGTLIDSMPGLTSLATKVIQQYYDIPEVAARNAYVETVGVPFEEQLVKAFGYCNPTAASDYEHRKVDLTLNAKTFPGALEVIKLTKLCDIGVALISSTKAYILEQTLNGRDLMSGFDLVFGLNGAGEGKKIQAWQCLTTWEARYGRALYIGDSDEDERIANQLVMDFYRVGVNEDWEKLLKDLWLKMPELYRRLVAQHSLEKMKNEILESLRVNKWPID